MVLDLGSNISQRTLANLTMITDKDLIIKKYCFGAEIATKIYFLTFMLDIDPLPSRDIFYGVNLADTPWTQISTKMHFFPQTLAVQSQKGAFPLLLRL